MKLYSQSLFFIPSMLSLSNILYIFVVIFYRKWLMWNRGWYGCWHPNFGRQGSTKCRYKSNRSIIKLSKTLMYQTYYMNEWGIYKKSHTQCKNDIFNKFMFYYSPGSTKNSSKRKHKRIPWTDAEKKAINSELGHFISKMKVSGKLECHRCLRNKKELSWRSWKDSQNCSDHEKKVWHQTLNHF